MTRRTHTHPDLTRPGADAPFFSHWQVGTPERQAATVVYRFFGGLTHEEIAEVLKVSVPTVRRDWRLARAWLSNELKK